MSDWSYKGSNTEYRDKRHTPDLEEERNRYPKKKKKKKDKRANHKHEYVPSIFHHKYKDFMGDIKDSTSCGSFCKYCGKVRDLRLMFINYDERLKRFKKEYPNYVEITLSDDWDYFKDKYVPI